MCSTRQLWNRRGRDRMVDGFTTTYVISAYHNRSCEFESVYDEVYSIKHYVFVLCALCCRFLWIVPSSCVPYVAGFSGLSLRLVCPMLPVSLDCPFVLCALCCRFLWIVPSVFSTFIH